MSLWIGVWNRRRRGVVGGHVGRRFIFSRNRRGGRGLRDDDVKCTCFSHQGAILHEMVFRSADVADTAAVLDVAAAAAFALRALLVAAVLLVKVSL